MNGVGVPAPHRADQVGGYACGHLLTQDGISVHVNLVGGLGGSTLGVFQSAGADPLA